MQNVGAFADARAPQRGMTGKGTRVRSARMSCSMMTLIDSVAPFGLFSCCPFGKVAQQAGFPVAGMETKYIHPVLCRPESASGLAHVSPST